MKTTLNTMGSTTIARSNRQDLDFYQTPSYATKTLIERFDFKSNFIWEPMAGNGMIAKELKKSRLDVYTTDIVTERGVGSAVAYMLLCFDRDTWLDPNEKTELEWIA